MKILPDTSLLVAALVETHLHHPLAFPWLQSVQSGKVTGVVAAHTLAEVYSVLTRSPLQPPISPTEAWQTISVNVLAFFEVVALSADEYQNVLAQLAVQGTGGGQTYDALIAKAALLAQVDHVVTFMPNTFADFQNSPLK